MLLANRGLLATLIYGALFLAITIGTIVVGPPWLAEPLGHSALLTIVLLTSPFGRRFELSASRGIAVIQRVVVVVALLVVFIVILEITTSVYGDTFSIKNASTAVLFAVLVHQLTFSEISAKVADWLTKDAHPRQGGDRADS